MKLKKREVLAILESLPQNIEVDDLIERILFLKSVGAGLSDLRKGKEMTQVALEEKYVFS